ncbi:MAG: hypothetical protein WAW31_14555 [Smithella sp.]
MPIIFASMAKISFRIGINLIILYLSFLFLDTQYTLPYTPARKKQAQLKNSVVMIIDVSAVRMDEALAHQRNIKIMLYECANRYN